MAHKPKLRTDAYYDLHHIIVAALEKIAKENLIYTSCINCINFKKQQELCGLCNLRPPAETIVFGCPQWEDKDQVPF